MEVITEFLNPPAATLTEHPFKNGLPDQDISWGVARLGHGKAFDLGAPPNRPSHVQVRRQYETVNGRTILIEGVPLTDIRAQLQALPLQASAFPGTAPASGVLVRAPRKTPSPLSALLFPRCPPRLPPPPANP